MLGKTSLGKTYFIQNVAENNFFRETIQAYWISGVHLSLARAAEIQPSFSFPIDFFNVSDYEDLNILINNLKERNESINNEDNVNNSIYSENKKLDYLIVMDDVSAIADSHRCDFADFLTVSRKYRCNVVMLFT